MAPHLVLGLLLVGVSVGIAIGYEHRVQKASYDPDPVIVAGLGADVPTSPARGGFNVDEVYGELRVPILANTPFFYRLELDGAVAANRRRSVLDDELLVAPECGDRVKHPVEGRLVCADGDEDHGRAKTLPA